MTKVSRYKLIFLRIKYTPVKSIFQILFTFLGWLFKLKLKDADEIKTLMHEEQYSEFLKSDH